jgi:protein gp37
MKPEWALDIRDQCIDVGVAFFFKQWGGRSPKAAGRLLEGKEWNEFPPTPSASAQLQFQVSA